MGMKKLQGGCHCGAVRFEIETDPSYVSRCNCSICIRKGALMSSMYIPAEDFQPPEDMACLSDYRWNDRVVNHLFCKTCGIYPLSSENGSSCPRSEPRATATATSAATSTTTWLLRWRVALAM